MFPLKILINSKLSKKYFLDNLEFIKILRGNMNEIAVIKKNKNLK